MSADKIRTIDQLTAQVAELRSSGRTVVHCHGVFDLLHIGHIRYLQQAAALGDALVVTVTPDRFVNKGPHRPAFAESLRVDAVAALDCVRLAAINQWPTAVEAIQALRPDIYAKGGEYRDQRTPESIREEAALLETGGRLHFIDEYTSSSSHLINQYLSAFPVAVEQYLREFRSRFTAAQVLGYLDRARELTLTVVGEAMIDEYYNCSAIGRSAKAPVVATRYESHERHLGGGAVVANHLAAFCREVRLVAMLGEADSHEPWIRKRLRENIEPRFVFKKNAPTIIKRRYRESYFDTPLFEINYFDDRPLTDDEERQVAAAVARELDVEGVVVADYGHTMLSGPTVKLLSGSECLLCVNTQANAANFGTHSISKYGRADYAALARKELEVECRERGDDLSSMLGDVAERLSAARVVVTLGKDGCLSFDRVAGEHRAQGLCTTVVDRIGGGDAFYAMSALCFAQGAPPEIAAFLGNVAGAEAVARVGGGQYLDNQQLRRHVQSLLK